MNMSLSVSVLLTEQGRKGSVAAVKALITAAHKGLMLFVSSVSVHNTGNLTGGTLIRQVGHGCPRLSKNVSGFDAPQCLTKM